LVAQRNAAERPDGRHGRHRQPGQHPQPGHPSHSQPELTP
jgi:hypothetical protein